MVRGKEHPQQVVIIVRTQRGRVAVRALLEAALAGRYVIEGELGRGGMATVWRCRELAHDRAVAVKVLEPDLATAVGVDRFIREVRLTSRLQHPNILSLLDSGSLTLPNGSAVPWYAMPFVPGESLRQRLAREHQLSVDEALRIGLAVADALAAAHRAGIVHRDIKPENVLLSGDATWVADFGIAKALAEGDAEHLTSTGFAIGTPAYMSPEQATGSQVSASSDQYSLASVIYEMLAGDPPFIGSTAQAIMARRMTEMPRSLRPVRPTVPVHVDEAVLRALSPVPADRFPDVGAFVAALRGGGSVARPADPGRRRTLTIALALVAALLAAAAWRMGRRPAAPAADPQLASLIQRGREAYATRTPTGTADAIELFNAAVGRDSTSSEAWAGLSRSYARVPSRGFLLPGLTGDEAVRRAVAAANRSIAADSFNAEGWLARAQALALVDPTDRNLSLRAVERALALDSSSAGAWRSLGTWLAEQGDLRGGMAAWQRSARVSPGYVEALAFVALGHMWQRQFDSAAAWADSALVVDPTYVLAWGTQGFVAVEQGDHARAIASFEAAERLSTSVEAINARAGVALAQARAGHRDIALAILRAMGSEAVEFGRRSNHTAEFFAEAFAAAGQPDSAIAWLARFQPRRDLHFQLHLRCDPALDPVRSSAAFRALLIHPEATCA